MRFWWSSAFDGPGRGGASKHNAVTHLVHDAAIVLTYVPVASKGEIVTNFTMRLSINRNDGAPLEQLEIDTVRLRDSLLQLDHVESAKLARSGSAPPGAKGNPAVVGDLIVTCLAAGGVATTLIQTFANWLRRDEHRGVTIEINGNKLSLTGGPAELQAELVRRFLDNVSFR